MMLPLNARYQVGICESQPATAEGMALAICNTPDLHCPWTEQTLQGALLRAREQPVDLLMVDIAIVRPVLEETVTEFHSFSPGIPVLVWGSGLASPGAERLLRIGAAGWINKTAATGTLLTSIRALLAGGSWPKVEWKVGQIAANGLSRLTGREAQVLELLAAGMPAKAIGNRLGIAHSTVKVHCRGIYWKLRIRGREDLANVDLSRKVA